MTKILLTGESNISSGEFFELSSQVVYVLRRRGFRRAEDDSSLSPEISQTIEGIPIKESAVQPTISNHYSKGDSRAELLLYREGMGAVSLDESITKASYYGVINFTNVSLKEVNLIRRAIPGSELHK